jgi:hypothetical protein
VQPKVKATQLLAGSGRCRAIRSRVENGYGGQPEEDHIVQAFEKHGLQPFDSSVIQPFFFFSKEGNKEYRGANIVGYIEGALDPDRYIVVTTPYEHLGVINT